MSGDVAKLPWAGDEGIDRSTHETVVEYGAREMMKRKSPSTAASVTAKKLSEKTFFSVLGSRSLIQRNSKTLFGSV